MNNDIKEKPTPDNTIEIDVDKLKTSNIKLNKIFKEKDDWFIEYYDIKEILSKMERLIVYGQYNAYYDLEKQLLDYITNLQEEIHKKEAMYDSLAVDYRLSQEENEKVHKDFDELSERYFFTKSRNEKAIEYIKEYVPIINNNLFTKEHQLERYKEKEKYNEKFINELLNILNGGDEE